MGSSSTTTTTTTSSKISRLVFYADMGLYYSGNVRARLAEKAAADEYDFVLHGGDISYADTEVRRRIGTAYTDWLERFYWSVSSYGRSKPYMLIPGNHESTACGTEHPYQEYKRRAANMPYGSGAEPGAAAAAASSERQGMYYAFDHAGARFITLSAEEDALASKGSAEMRWLKHELELAYSRKKAGALLWIVTAVHYMTIPHGYCTSANHAHAGCCVAEDDCEHLLDPVKADVSQYVEDLFAVNQVDVHLTGHQHVYERTSPVYRFKAQPPEADTRGDSYYLDPAYPVYVVNGCPGNVEVMHGFTEPRPSWSVGARSSEFGYVTIAYSDTSFNVSYLDARHDGVIDEFTIAKTNDNERRRASHCMDGKSAVSQVDIF
jgi:hypothetical protein